MALESLDNAVKNILRTEEFYVQVTDAGLEASKGSMYILISIPEHLDHLLESIINLSDADTEPGTHLVVVAPDTPDEETLHIAKAKGVVIWTQEDIEEERGISILRKFIKDPPSSLVKRIIERMPLFRSKFSVFVP